MARDCPEKKNAGTGGKPGKGAFKGFLTIGADLDLAVAMAAETGPDQGGEGREEVGLTLNNITCPRILEHDAMATMAIRCA